jgi:DNA replication initiation complex subunit (GINS family)
VSDEDGITYEDLKSKLDKQQRSGKPVTLAADFYERAHAYVEELLEEYESVHARDPAGNEVQILRDELFRAQETLNDLFDARARKILSHALSEDGSIEQDALTPEERRLFERVKDQVATTRSQVLEAATRSDAYRVVRVLEDVPSFTASDLRIYDLGPEDVASLPEETADLLVSRGKVQPIQD